jgi:hypothetical protein
MGRRSSARLLLPGAKSGSLLNLKYGDCAQQLREGEPSIEVNAGQDGLVLTSYNLYPGEERIVGYRLREILREAAGQG